MKSTNQPTERKPDIKTKLTTFALAATLAPTSTNKVAAQSAQRSPAGNAVRVTADNFNRAESDVNFGFTVKDAGFGKFPGTVPSMIATIYLQAHHIDLEFYDKFYKPGGYLRTHADHIAWWHGAEAG